MPKGVPITEFEEAKIKAALRKNPDASAVAHASRGAWSYSTLRGRRSSTFIFKAAVTRAKE
jgi:hypothetical protein